MHSVHRKRYSKNLKCPCSQTDISYEAFVTINVRCHPVCSSHSLDGKWINALLTVNGNESTRRSAVWAEKLVPVTKERFGSLSIFSRQVIAAESLRIEAQEV